MMHPRIDGPTTFGSSRRKQKRRPRSGAFRLVAPTIAGEMAGSNVLDSVESHYNDSCTVRARSKVINIIIVRISEPAVARADGLQKVQVLQIGIMIRVEGAKRSARPPSLCPALLIHSSAPVLSRATSEEIYASAVSNIAPHVEPGEAVAQVWTSSTLVGQSIV